MTEDFQTTNDLDSHQKNEFFIGRTDIVARIDYSGSKKIVILHGLPGVGKTSVASEYMHRKIDDQKFKKAYWFDADDKEKIVGQLFYYSSQQDYDPSISRDDAIRNFIESIKNSKDVLLVFDNVEVLDDVKNAIKFIDIYLLACKILLTTRNQLGVSRPRDVTSIEIPPFDVNEIKAFLKNISYNEGQVEAIMTKLASKYAENDVSKIEILPYKLVMLSSYASSVSQNCDSIFESSNEYMTGVLANLKHRSSEVTDLLKHVMLIDPDHIPGKLIERILLNRGDYKKAVKVLKEQNLCKIIRPNTKHYGISVHRLLQQDLKDNLGLTKKQIADIENDLLVLLEDEFPETKYQPDNNWNVADLYYRHIKKLEHVLPSIESNKASRLYFKLALYRGNVLKDYNLMEAGLSKALEFLNTSSVSDDLAKIYFGLGNAYSFLGNETKALDMYKLTAITYESIDGKSYQCDLATAYNYIGKTYSILGITKEALEYKEEALKMRTQIFKGNDHHDITASYDSIATSYLNLNDYPKALNYCKMSLDMRKRIYQNDNYYLAMSYNFIGLIYAYLGNQKLALDNYNKALSTRISIYQNNDNAEVAVSYNNIGCYYSDLKNEAKAFHYKMKSLEMRERLYKKDHIRKAVAYHDIGKSHSNVGNEEEALRFYKMSLEMKEKIYQKQNADLALMHKDIASSFAISGNKNESLKHFDISLEIIQKLDKNDLAYKAAVIYEKGQMHSYFGYEAEALECFQNALDMQKRYFENKDDRNLVFSLNAISLSYSRQGNREKALEYHKLSCEMYSRLFAEDGLEKAVLINDLGLIYFYTGEHEKAIEQFNKSIEMIKKLSEEEAHPDIAASLKYIGLAYSKLGNKAEALKHDELCLKIRKALFTEYLKYFTNSAELETKIFGDSDQQYLRLINYRKSIQQCMV